VGLLTEPTSWLSFTCTRTRPQPQQRQQQQQQQGTERLLVLAAALSHDGCVDAIVALAPSSTQEEEGVSTNHLPVYMIDRSGTLPGVALIAALSRQTLQ
jgi:hypothetical protein